MKLVIAGDSDFAEIAALYFSRNSEIEVVGHIVNSGFKKNQSINGLPVEEIESHTGQQLILRADHYFVAVTYIQMNRVRKKLCSQLDSFGLVSASYVSPQAYVDPTAIIGPHCFIFENNVIQASVNLGSNCVLWSGNHIGHHSVIGENVFISSHVVLSGHCRIGDYSFLGVNSTVSNNVEIGSDVWLGPNSLVTQNIPSNTFIRSDPSSNGRLGPREYFGIS